MPFVKLFSLERYAEHRRARIAINAVIGAGIINLLSGPVALIQVQNKVSDKEFAESNRALTVTSNLNICGGRNLDHQATIDFLAIDLKSRPEVIQRAKNRFPQYVCGLFASTGQYVIKDGGSRPPTTPGSPGVPVPPSQAKPPAPASGSTVYVPVAGPRGAQGLPGKPGPRGMRGLPGTPGPPGLPGADADVSALQIEIQDITTSVEELREQSNQLQASIQILEGKPDVDITPLRNQLTALQAQVQDNLVRLAALEAKVAVTPPPPPPVPTTPDPFAP